MATVKFYIPIDMRTFAGYNHPLWSSPGGGSGSSTEYRAHYDYGFYEVMRGTSLSGFGAGFWPQSGTITDWEFGIAEVVYDPLNPFVPLHIPHTFWTFSGLSVDAPVISAAATSDGETLAAYMATLLAGNDNIQGSTSGDYLIGFDGDDSLFGFGGNDTLEGAIGNDTLDGGSGIDTLIGGVGDDIYIVDNSADILVEGASAGADLVKSSVSFVLGANLERLQLTGSAAINATGNGLNNVLNGNSGNNVLDGNGGADAMGGGLGDDTYVVDNVGDAVVENASAGIDLVKSSITYTLGNNVEKLQLTGSAMINGTGNALNNVLNGNAGANVLDGKSGGDTIGGGGGDDTIYGGLGNDQLSGGAGADKFVFDTALGAGNFDRISDFSAGEDRIVLDQSIFGAVALSLSVTAFHAGTAAQDSLDRIIYDDATGRIWYDSDGTGAGAAVLFAQVQANAGLTIADFFVQA